VLGTLTKTLGAVSTLATTVDTLTGGQRRDRRSEQDLALRQLQARQANSEREAQSQAQADRERLTLERQQNEKRRRKALRRAVARRNAKVGASGTSRAGSNEAVLLGLVNDADDDTQDNNALDQLRFNTIDRGLENLQTRNVLERTQLAEQQRLQRAIGVF
jgi:hypothetical protein